MGAHTTFVLLCGAATAALGAPLYFALQRCAVVWSREHFGASPQFLAIGSRHTEIYS